MNNAGDKSSKMTIITRRTLLKFSALTGFAGIAGMSRLADAAGRLSTLENLHTAGKRLEDLDVLIGTFARSTDSDSFVIQLRDPKVERNIQTHAGTKIYRDGTSATLQEYASGDEVVVLGVETATGFFVDYVGQMFRTIETAIRRVNADSWHTASGTIHLSSRSEARSSYAGGAVPLTLIKAGDHIATMGLVRNSQGGKWEAVAVSLDERAK